MLRISAFKWSSTCILSSNWNEQERQQMTYPVVFFYQAVIRPVAEYACPVWHSPWTVCRPERPHWIDPTSSGENYLQQLCVHDALQLANLHLLAERRDQLTGRFFDKMRGVNNLHYLLAAQRDSCIGLTNSLRTAQKYPVHFAKSTILSFSDSIYLALLHSALHFVTLPTVYVAL